jgi:hypothetical protein
MKKHEIKSKKNLVNVTEKQVDVKQSHANASGKHADVTMNYVDVTRNCVDSISIGLYIFSPMAFNNKKPANLLNTVVVPFPNTPRAPLSLVLPLFHPSPTRHLTFVQPSVFPIHHAHLRTNPDGPWV